MKEKKNEFFSKNEKNCCEQFSETKWTGVVNPIEYVWCCCVWICFVIFFDQQKKETKTEYKTCLNRNHVSLFILFLKSEFFFSIQRCFCHLESFRIQSKCSNNWDRKITFCHCEIDFALSTIFRSFTSRLFLHLVCKQTYTKISEKQNYKNT